MVPSGIPDFLTRERRVRSRIVLVERRARLGYGPVERVEFSADGDRMWEKAELGDSLGPHAWRSCSCEWDAKPGEYEFHVRATDAIGKT